MVRGFGVAPVHTLIPTYIFFARAKQPAAKVYRITKPMGGRIIDDGHESRQATLKKVNAVGQRRVVEETTNHLKCILLHSSEN